MRKLILGVAALALLSACTETEVEEETMVEETAEPAVVTDVNGETMDAYLGEWTVTYPDGASAVSTNNADGTYSMVLPDGQTATGTWTFGAEESCWTVDAEGSPTDCYTVGAPDENGMRVLTMADGTSITVTPVAVEEDM